MANTYTQIHIQAVFAVQNRDCVIGKKWKDELYKYITGIIQNHNHKLLAINGMPDHLHIFFGMRPTQSISDLMQQVKGDSSKWINEKKFIHSKFSWQGTERKENVLWTFLAKRQPAGERCFFLWEIIGSSGNSIHTNARRSP